MKNVGGLDKKLRLALGVILIGVGLVPALVGIPPNGIVHWVTMGVGLVSFATGFLGVCPAYFLIGVNTCGVKKP